MATTVASNPVEMPVSAAASPTVLDRARWSPGGQPLQPMQTGSRSDEQAMDGNGSHQAVHATLPQNGSRVVSSDNARSSGGSNDCSGDPRGRSPLIVFDWDDTMLTSSWIQSRELLQAASYDELPADAQRDLAHLEQSVVKCLTHARTQGTVIIITNAESGWVELSAAKFFSNLLPLLEGVPVVSARSLFEAQFPGSPLCWKSAAFAYMMHDHFMEYPRWAPKMIVSVGDSNEEKVAMRIASCQHTSMTSKAVKFVAGPDPEALAAQLDIVTTHLEWILSREGDAELVLSPAMINGTDTLPMHSCRPHDEPASDGSVRRSSTVTEDSPSLPPDTDYHVPDPCTPSTLPPPHEGESWGRAQSRAGSNDYPSSPEQEHGMKPAMQGQGRRLSGQKSAARQIVRSGDSGFSVGAGRMTEDWTAGSEKEDGGENEAADVIVAPHWPIGAREGQEKETCPSGISFGCTSNALANGPSRGVRNRAGVGCGDGGGDGDGNGDGDSGGGGGRRASNTTHARTSVGEDEGLMNLPIPGRGPVAGDDERDGARSDDWGSNGTAGGDNGELPPDRNDARVATSSAPLA